MRRALVLTSEAARHPFRASFPPFVLTPHEVEKRRPWRAALTLDAGDLRDFLMAYCACFLAATAFFF